MVTTIILVARAATLEGQMDGMFEVYKNRLMDNKGVEVLNPDWNTYNPLAPKKGLWGTKRDGWHNKKFKMYQCLFAAIGTFFLECMFYLYLTNFEIVWWQIALIAIGGVILCALARGYFFEASLAKSRRER